MDLIIDVFILVERERSTQAHIHDHTNRPHVQRAIVSLVQEHLRGQVSRRAHDRTAERLLSNDASKTKVTKFHLCICSMGGKKCHKSQQRRNETLHYAI